MPAFCPLCASDELTEEGRTADGRPFGLCREPDHGADGFVWEMWQPPTGNVRGDGLGAELGVWDKLLDCIPATAEFVSYGAVEDSFIDRYPAEAKELLNRYGHRWRDSPVQTAHYSMSVYLACRLKDLQREGFLDQREGPAEGPWAYNGIISWWRKSS